MGRVHRGPGCADAANPHQHLGTPARLARGEVPVAACNPSGCTDSDEVPVTGLGNDAVGYFKPATSAYNHWYGSAVALSADGRTLVTQTGENIGTAVDSVTVQVYRKISATSSWRREARLKPTAPPAYTIQPYWSGNPLALSGRGNLLAFGVPTEETDSPEGRVGGGLPIPAQWQPMGSRAETQRRSAARRLLRHAGGSRRRGYHAGHHSRS